MDGLTSSVENLDAVTRLIKISIPSTEVDREYNSSLDRVAQQASIKGFRPGKAPKQLVATLHGSYVRNEVIERLVNSSLQDVVKKNELDIIGSPQIEGAEFELGKPLEFTAKVAIFPRPEVKEYNEFALKVGRRTPVDGDVDQVIERMRQSKGTPRRLEFRQTAQKGDIIDASVVSQLEGETGARPEPINIELGAGNLPPELEDGIPGMQVGETKTVAGAVPASHRDAALRGKQVNYQVTLNSLSEKILPEVNDDFAKSIELNVGSVLELRMKVRESLEEESKRQAQVDAEAALLEQLVERNQFEVPQVLVDEEIRALIVRSGFVNPEKVDVRTIDVAPFRDGLGEMASKRVRSAILVDRIGELEKITADTEDINKRITDIALENAVTEDEVRKFLAKEGRMVNLAVELGRSKVMKFLMQKAKLEYFEKPAEKTAEAEQPVTL